MQEKVETDIESATETSETVESDTQPVAMESAETSETEILPATREVISNENSATPDTEVVETVDNTTSETPVFEITPADVEALPVSDAVATDEDATDSETAENASENVEITDAIAPTTQSANSVNTQLISRLETLTQTLKERGTDAVVSGGNSVTPALLERLETLTENLKTQNNSQPASVKTTELVSRLEEMVVRSTPPAPIAPSSFEFPQKNQPLVGVIDTGFSGDNPDINYSRITWGEDRVDGDDDPTLKAGEGNEHGTHLLGIIAATQNNGIGIDGINNTAPIWAGRAVGSGKWAESLVEFVDAARESGQPNAVVNLSLDLTQIDAEGNVTTRYEFTPMERAAIEYARQNNVMLVVAAGNDGGVMSALGQSSQEFDNIITVGAAEQFDPETSAWKGADRTELF